MKKGRFYISLVGLAATLAFIGYYPLPHYVWGNFVVRPKLQQNVTLNQPGRLTQIVTAESDEVEPGQVIAILQNEQLELDRVDLEVRKSRLQQELSVYQTMSSVQQNASRRIAEIVFEHDKCATTDRANR